MRKSAAVSLPAFAVLVIVALLAGCSSSKPSADKLPAPRQRTIKVGYDRLCPYHAPLCLASYPLAMRACYRCFVREAIAASCALRARRGGAWMAL